MRRASRALTPEGRLAALAAAGLWVSMFLPWYGKSVTEPVRGSLRAASYSLSAFGAFSFVEAAVLLVASSVLALLFARTERRAFHLPGGDGFVILLAGGWTALLVFYRMLDKPRTTGNAQLTTTIGLQWGIFAAMAAALGLGYAGTRLRAAHRPEPARGEDPTLRRWSQSAADEDKSTTSRRTGPPDDGTSPARRRSRPADEPPSRPRGGPARAAATLADKTVDTTGTAQLSFDVGPDAGGDTTRRHPRPHTDDDPFRTDPADEATRRHPRPHTDDDPFRTDPADGAMRRPPRRRGSDPFGER